MPKELWSVTDRYDVALAAVDPQPGDRILEVGCGHGAMVDRLCAALAGDGHVHAIDRSETMIEMATRRNASWIEAGIASFGAVAVEDATVEEGSLDSMVAIRVRALWADGPAVLERVAAWLRPGGAIHLVLDDPGAERLEQEAVVASTALVAAGLSDVQRSARSPGTVVVSGRRD